jgi:hypothetical protein
MTLDVKKSNSSNETPNVMTVGVEKYGLTKNIFKATSLHTYVQLMYVKGCQKVKSISDIFPETP